MKQYSLFDDEREKRIATPAQAPVRNNRERAGEASPSLTGKGAGKRAAEELRPRDAGGGPYKEEPPAKAWRGPESGKRFLKLRLANGTSITIETALTMGELANELRSRAKVALTLADGRSVDVRLSDVAYMENEYRVRV